MDRESHLATLESLSPAILSPVVQHYITIKQLHPGVLLLYRIGDFFEAFFEDAVTIADDLELKLTSKSMLTTKDAAKRLDDKRIPMTGFPYHAIKRYGALLLAHGYSVAICDLARELQVIRPEGNPEIPTPDDTPTITATLVKVFIDGTKEVDALIQDDTSLDGIEL